MITTRAQVPADGLTAYALNLSRSHRDWLLSVRLPGEPAEISVEGQPLRRLVHEGDDLVLEFGASPGRPRRLRMTGPFTCEARRAGLELELCLEGPRGSRHTLRLAPPLRS